MKHLIVILFVLLIKTGFGQGAVVIQDKNFAIEFKPDSALISMLNKDVEYRALSKFEKETIYWISLMRKDPPRFCQDYVKPFLSQFPELRGSEAKALERDLNNAGSLSVLFPGENLKRSAQTQAEYLAKTNRFSHDGPKGKSFKQRMDEVGISECAGENLFEGKSDPLMTLILLLIDHGVQGGGHRKALMNPSFNKIGVGMVEEKPGFILMVQDFSCK